MCSKTTSNSLAIPCVTFHGLNRLAQKSKIHILKNVSTSFVFLMFQPLQQQQVKDCLKQMTLLMLIQGIATQLLMALFSLPHSSLFIIYQIAASTGSLKS